MLLLAAAVTTINDFLPYLFPFFSPRKGTLADRANLLGEI
jgi:hypothetical protein